MQTHDSLSYVIAAYSVTWFVFISYATYLWRTGRRLNAERLQ